MASAVTVSRWNQNVGNPAGAVTVAQSGKAPTAQYLVPDLSYEQNRNAMNPMTDFGIYVTGCIVPPADGEYTFYTCSDDQSSFALSPDDDIAKAVVIATQTGWNGAEAFTTLANGVRTTGKATLTAGKPYAFWFAHQNGAAGGTNGSLGWSGPDPIGTTIVVVKGAYIQPLPVALAITAKVAPAMVGSPATFNCVLPLSSLGSANDGTVTWFKKGDAGDTEIGTGLSYTIAAVTDADAGLYYCKLGTLVSNDAKLAIQHGLVHRYTFNEDAVEDDMVIKDVVGGENFDAFLYGNSGKGVFKDGKFFFGNTNQGSANPATGDYIDLANGMISSLGVQMTVESWWTNTSVTGQGIWERIWDFGTSNGGEDVSGSGSNTRQIYVCPRNGSGNLMVEYYRGSDLGGGSRQINTTPNRPIPINQEVAITLVWDEVSGLCKLYYNGVIVGRNLTTFTLSQMTDNNNWIGRSQWGDPLAQGAINELRIWDTALSASEIARHALIGPEDASLAGPIDPNACPVKTVGDENGDCVLDFVDYAAMVERWMMDVTVLQ